MARRSRHLHHRQQPTARRPAATGAVAPWSAQTVRSGVAVFAVAMVVRLIVAAQLWDLPLVRTPQLDSAEYLSWARRLAAGDFSWPIVSAHGPGYPLFLASLLALFSGSLPVVLSVQAVVGALTAVMIALIAAAWFGPRVGLLAGLIDAVYGPVVYVETALLAEGLLLFLLVAALLILSRNRLTVIRAVMAGLALGAAAVVRPTALLVLAGLVVWLTIEVRLSQRRAWPLVLALVLGCAAVLTPALIKNESVAHHLGLQGFGGLNFYIGNSPLHTGRPTFRLGTGWDALNAEASRGGVNDPVAQDSYYITKTLAEIRQYPGAFLKLLGQKCVWLIQAEEVRDSHSFYFFAERSWLLRMLPRMSVLFSLACLGIVSLVRTPRRPALLAWYAIGAAVTTIALVVGSRYRMPLAPVLAILTAVGLMSAASVIKKRRAIEIGVYAAVLIAAIFVSHAYSDPINHNLAEEWALTGSSLVSERNLPEAEMAYRRALTLDSSSALAWDGLGLVFYDSHRLTEARQAFQRALSRDPQYSMAVFHQALVDEQEGRMDAAIDGYRRALDLSPQNVDITRHLGLALLAAGKPADAIAYLQTVVEQMPFDADAHRVLATALGVAGRIPAATREMRKVVELSPVNGEAWLDLSLLSLDGEDVDSASAALQRARNAGASPERLAFASAAIEEARRKARPVAPK